MGHIRCTEVIPGVPSDVFDFLTRPENQAELLSEDIEVEYHGESLPVSKGHEYPFTMTRMAMSQPVRLKVTQCVKGESITYKQSEGLFAKWQHSMRFAEHGPNETLVTDLVEYEMPLGLVGRLVDDLWVRGDMGQVLKRRLEKAKEHFLKLNKDESQLQS